MVSSWHSCRQSSRRPSATPGKLRMRQCPVMFPLQASNCTKLPWGWSVWRTVIQFRERALFIFCCSDVIWMYLKMCALWCYLCLKSFPPSSFPSLITKQPNLAQFQSPETMLSKSLSDSESPSCKDPPCWLIQLSWNRTAIGNFQMESCPSLLCYQTEDIWNQPQWSLLMFIVGVLRIWWVRSREVIWPVGCLHMGTGYVVI